MTDTPQQGSYDTRRCYIDWTHPNAPTIRWWHGEPVAETLPFEDCRHILINHASDMYHYWAGFVIGVRRKTVEDVH